MSFLVINNTNQLAEFDRHPALFSHVVLCCSEKDRDINETLHTHFGLAHTRWATHGEPSAVNSHPQRSDKNNGNKSFPDLIINHMKGLNFSSTFLSSDFSLVLFKLCQYESCKTAFKIILFERTQCSKRHTHLSYWFFKVCWLCPLAFPHKSEMKQNDSTLKSH